MLVPMAVPDWLAGDARIVHRDHRAARSGATTSWPEWLPDDIRASINAAGITAPWRHQTDLADLAHGGQHAAICTSTASGKSLAYLMPIMAATASATPTLGVPTDGVRQRLISPRAHTALYLSPTKALAHDQARAARALGPDGWRVTTLDGDSDQVERRYARDHASFVLTNPDMLHLSVLPQHQRWAGLLGGLRYVVVDEAHRYRGVFGAHVAQVLRRLRRLCASYGAAPTFVLASATATDVGELGGALIGEDSVEVVAEDHSPRPARDMLLWQPADSPANDATETVVIDFPNRIVREPKEGEGKYRYGFRIATELVRTVLRDNEPDWVNTIFLSTRFTTWRIGGYNEYLYTFFKCLTDERIAYADGWFAEAHDDTASITLDGYEIQRRCPHLKADLSKFGVVEGNTLTCNLHGWQWDLPTGRCLTSKGHELRSSKLDS